MMTPDDVAAVLTVELPSGIEVVLVLMHDDIDEEIQLQLPPELVALMN